jgi:hypothetical protein
VTVVLNNGLSSNQKVRLIAKNPDIFQDDGLLDPLRKTNGVVFPYTPTLQITHSANYGTYDITHSVYQQHYYVNTPNPIINLTATFTAQDINEAAYSAASLHFLKSMTKGNFGSSDRQTAGTPPPVLLFTAYGHLNFKNVPVVVKSVNWTYLEEVDFVQIETDNGPISIPSQFLISLDLGVQYPPTQVRREFDIRKYRSGGLLNDKGFV